MLACFKKPKVVEPVPFAVPKSVGTQLDKAVEATIAKGVIASLTTTKEDLKWDGPAKDHEAVLKQSYLELSDYASYNVAAGSRLRAGRPPPLAGSPTESASSVAELAGGSLASTLGSWETVPSSMNDSIHEEWSEPPSSDDQNFIEDGAPEVRAEEVYAANGLDFHKMQGAAHQFLHTLGMRPHEVGARNYSRWRGRTLWNQCFYLSVSYGYLGHKASERRYRGLARRLRRAIEAVVLEQHPSWAAGLEASAAGKGRAMVFADFLPLAMHTTEISIDKNLLAKFVVVILDSVLGHAEAYVGPAHASLKDRAEQAKHLIVLWHTPAHYQCIVRDKDGSKLDHTYTELRDLLFQHAVPFIETRE